MTQPDTSREAVEPLIVTLNAINDPTGLDRRAATLLRALLDRAERAEHTERARRQALEEAARIAAERGAWASNDLDSEAPLDRLRAEGRMDAAQEIAAAIRALIGEAGNAG